MEDSPILPNKPNPNTYIQQDTKGDRNQVIGQANDSTIVNFAGDGQVINITVNERLRAPHIPPPIVAVQQLTQEEYRQRQVLRDKVKHHWVKGVLEKSLHARVSIELGLQERPDLVPQPFREAAEFADAAGQALPENTPATTVFDNMGSGRTLLILGEPGAGKTIALLKLAEDLIARAEEDLRQQIPVVFNLSSWANKAQSIEQWLIQELWERYQVSKTLGKTWVKGEALILLLDGLDEVKIEQRNACVQALNTFMQIHGKTEIVICCRIGDYQMLQDRLTLRSAICIQPLTAAQLNLYFEQAGGQLSALKAVLSQDEELQKLAKSPLMLSVMSLAYKDFKPEHLTVGGTIEDYRKRLFDTYIDRMFRRRKKITQSQEEYCREKEDAKRWLAWLAQRMKVASQSEFLIESLQPSWLSDKRQKLFKDRHETSINKLPKFMRTFMNFFIMRNDATYIYFASNNSDRYAALIFSLIFGLINSSLISGLIGVTIKIVTDSEVSYWFGKVFLFVIVFFISSISYLSEVAAKDIKPVENTKWSLQAFINKFPIFMIYGLIYGLIVGLIFGLIGQGFGLVFGLNGMNGLNGLVFGLVFGLNVVISFWIMSGFQKDEIQKQKPNQGIFRSALNALIIGMLSSLIIGVSSGMIWGVSNGMVWGVFGGEFFGLSFGGNAVLRHFALRFTLYRKRYAPWNYARFLDYATERLFLQKVGGGYIFIHRMLLEHFAEMSIEQK